MNFKRRYTIDESEVLNKKFGRLFVEKTYRHPKRKILYCECVCDCGNKKNVTASLLTRNLQLSCGCHRLEMAKQKGKTHRAWAGHGEISNTFWNSIKRSSEKREIPMTLTIQDGWNLFLKQSRKCALSGIDLKFSEDSSTFKDKTASLDRIDSSKGYTIDNVQWVHKDVNMMKQGFNQLYFFDLCKQISNNECKSEIIRRLKLRMELGGGITDTFIERIEKET